VTPEDAKAIIEGLEAIRSAISALIFTVGVFGCLLIWAARKHMGRNQSTAVGLRTSSERERK
jgi:hypothetical protein